MNLLLLQNKSEAGSRARVRIKIIVLIIMAILVLAGSWQYLVFNESAFFPKSGLVSSSGPVCYSYAASANVSEKNTIIPFFDEQFVLFFDQDFSLLQYNITAIAQNESYGNGPFYLVNGLANNGYWYQAGIVWNPLSLRNGSFPAPIHGFMMSYEVWNAATNESVFPTDGFVGNSPMEQGMIRNDDIVLVSLRFEHLTTNSGGIVNMSVYDWNTSAYASESYPSYNASKFVGKTNGDFFSGLMTEWHVTSPSFCSQDKVDYSNTLVPLRSAQICLFVTPAISSQSSPTGGCTLDTQFHRLWGAKYNSFSSVGFTAYDSPYEFVTS
ncbi:MAG: hypothetical protein M1368_02255 [Thaumarchaeota archaeon]|nr:hypothetical protein [Nitrososphaerota archaeon]